MCVYIYALYSLPRVEDAKHFGWLFWVALTIGCIIQAVHSFSSHQLSFLPYFVYAQPGKDCNLDQA